MNLSPRASRQMEEQRMRYLQSLPDKQAKIEQAWENARLEAWSRASFDKFRTLVHRLAGSAGSYGLVQLGQTVKCLDHLLGTIPPDEPPAERVEALKKELSLRLDEAIRSNRP